MHNNIARNNLNEFTLTEGPRRTGWGKCNSLAPCNHRGINNHKELINLSTYSPIHFKKVAFNLAEVLITIGVIGVVAAMTIPTLMANTRSQQYRSQFKKTLSTLSNAARMSYAQYGFDYAGTDVYPYEKSAEEKRRANPETEKSFASLFNGTLTGIQYLGTIDTPNGYKLINGPSMNVSGTVFEDEDIYQLSDGTIVGVGLASGNCISKLGCPGFIDVNGFALPNKEVTCSDDIDTTVIWNENYQDCIVKNDAQHMTDIFPVIYHDSIVEPATNAARYVLNNTK
ncbi:type II secretion system protein [bacterium]|nr:type II secretion system protein [bacterium]